MGERTYRAPLDDEHVLEGSTTYKRNLLLRLLVRYPTEIRSVSFYLNKPSPEEIVDESEDLANADEEDKLNGHVLSFRCGDDRKINGQEWNNTFERHERKLHPLQDCSEAVHAEITGLTGVRLDPGIWQMWIRARGKRLADQILRLDPDVPNSHSCIWKAAPLTVTSCDLVAEANIFPSTLNSASLFVGSLCLIDLEDMIPSLSTFMLSQLNETGQGFDVTFNVAGESILAHRLLLLRVPYFRTLLSGAFAEGRSDRDSAVTHITLQGVDPAAFRRVLQYIYTDDAEHIVKDLDIDCAAELARAAHVYNLCQLSRRIDRHLAHHVDGEKAFVTSILFDLAELASQASLRDLWKSITAYVRRNFAQIALTDDFRSLAQSNSALYKELIQGIGSAIANARRADEDEPSHKRPRASFWR